MWWSRGKPDKAVSSLPAQAFDFAELRQLMVNLISMLEKQDDLRKQVNRIERKVYRTAVNPGDDGQDLNDNSWIAGVK